MVLVSDIQRFSLILYRYLLAVLLVHLFDLLVHHRHVDLSFKRQHTFEILEPEMVNNSNLLVIEDAESVGVVRG